MVNPLTEAIMCLLMARVGRILDARRGGSRIRSVEDLKRLGVNTQRASDFMLVDGRKIAAQMRLF